MLRHDTAGAANTWITASSVVAASGESPVGSRRAWYHGTPPRGSGRQKLTSTGAIYKTSRSNAARLPPGCVFSNRCAHVEPGCREREPELNGDAGHEVACWRWRDILPGADGERTQTEKPDGSETARTPAL